MKNLLLTLFIAIISLSEIIAQVPQGVTYQAVARNNEGQPVSSKAIKLRISLIKNSIDGTVEYTELHNLTTNSLGLFTTTIGKGTSVLGKFAEINWKNSQKFIKVEIDLDNTGNFSLQGVSQLLSVPYSFYSAKSALADSASYSLKSSAANHALKADTATYAKNSIFFTAGTGIQINNNTIENTLPTQWGLANNNLNYTNGSVSIGSETAYPGVLGPYKFTVKGGNSSAGEETVMITSDSPWETQLGITNSTSNAGYFFNVTGMTNKNGAGNLNIVRSKSGSTFPFTISSSDFVGINNTNPSSRLEVNGDIELSEPTNGIIMTSPNGSCFKVTINDSGAFVSTPIACP